MAVVLGPNISAANQKNSSAPINNQFTPLGAPSGSLVIVFIACNNVTAPTISDDGLNTYTRIGNTGSTSNILIYYAWNANATNVITITPAATMSMGYAFFYATGVQTTSDPLDQNVTPTTGTSASPSITSGTLAATGELVIAGLCVNGPVAQDTFTQDTAHGWANIVGSSGTGTGGGNASSNWGWQGGYQIPSDTLAKTWAPTITSRTWQARLVSFKAAPAIVAPTTQQCLTSWLTRI